MTMTTELLPCRAMMQWADEAPSWACGESEKDAARFSDPRAMHQSSVSACAGQAVLTSPGRRKTRNRQNSIITGRLMPSPMGDTTRARVGSAAWRWKWLVVSGSTF